MRKGEGPRTVPRGTPDVTIAVSDVALSRKWKEGNLGKAEIR